MPVDIYAGEVEVPSQDRRHRDDGFRRALAEVLVKVSGQPDAAKRQAVEDALASAGEHVQQFEYRSVIDEPGDETTGNEGEPRIMLLARFDPSAVRNALRRADLPLWSDERPEVLVWLAIEGPNGRHLIGGEDPLAKDLRAHARERGVPILFPLLDLTDQRRLSVSEVWGGFTESIVAASERYAAETVLVGRLDRVSDGTWRSPDPAARWRGRWILYDHGREQAWRVRGASENALLGPGVHGAADRLARRYAFRLSERDPSAHRLVIANVDSLADYGRVLEHLRALAVVDEVMPSAMAQDRLTLAVRLQAPRRRLLQAIELGGVLRPDLRGPNPEAGAAMHLELVP